MRKHLYPEYVPGRRRRPRPATATATATATGEAAQLRGGRRPRRRDAGDHTGYSAWAS